MKRLIQNWMFALITLMVTAVALNAQYDDVYYDPDADVYYDQSYIDDNRRYDDEYDYYDDEAYSYYDDYDYHYTSRIRRFRRPNPGFGFYDPWFVDGFYYDPFYTDFWMPGTSIYFGFGGNDWWAWRRYRRWARWNMFGFNPVSAYYAFNYGPPAWGFGFGWNRWNRPFFNPVGGFYSFNYFNNFYFNTCPTPVFNNFGLYNNYVNVGEVRPNGVHYGPRTTGTVVSSPRGIVTRGAAVQPVLKGDKQDVTTRRGDYLKKEPSREKSNGVRNRVHVDDPKGTSIASEVQRRTKNGSKRVTKRPVYRPTVEKENYTTRRGDTRDRVGGNDRIRPDAPAGDRKRAGSDSGNKTYRPTTTKRQPERGVTSRTYVPKRERSINRDRSSSTRTYTPTRGNKRTRDAYTGNSRRSGRSYSPTRANRRSYSPSSGSTRSRSYSPARRSSSSRSYSPSRRSSSSRSYSPSRRSSSSRSYSPSRSSSSRSSSSARSSSRSSSRSSGSKSAPRRSN